MTVVGRWRGGERARAASIQLLGLSAGLSESRRSGLVDGQGQPGTNMFTATRLGGCLGPRGDFRT